MEEAELSCPFVTTKSNSSIATACYNLEYKWSFVQFLNHLKGAVS